MTQFSAVNVPTIVCISLVLQHYNALHQSAAALHPRFSPVTTAPGAAQLAPCSRKPSHNWQQTLRVFTHCKLSTVHCCEELRAIMTYYGHYTLSVSSWWVMPWLLTPHTWDILSILNKWMWPKFAAVQQCRCASAGRAVCVVRLQDTEYCGHSLVFQPFKIGPAFARL